MEFGVLPMKVLREDKAEYIQALLDARKAEDAGIFTDCMMKLHAAHLRADIERYKASVGEEMVDKAFFGGKIGRYRSVRFGQGRRHYGDDCPAVCLHPDHGEALFAAIGAVRPD